MAGGIKLSWKDRNFAENHHNIYKSNTPMSINNMPTPIATVDANITEYIDYDVIEGNTYYYRVGAVRGDDIAISDEIELLAEELDLGPGSNELIGGDMTAGFFGEVPASEFTTGDDLATSIGLTAGTSQYSDTPWLKFILDDEILYVPKKPIRYGISWRDIYQAGAVYGTDDNGLHPSGGDKLQDARVTIDGYEFKVTLMKGANTDPVPSDTAGYDVDWTHNSEWNRLMYPIHSGIHTYSGNPSNPSIPYNQWASYSDEDLLVHRDFGNGSYSWTQEQHPGSSSYRVYRGSFGVTTANRNIASSSNAICGFRPALRLVL